MEFMKEIEGLPKPSPEMDEVFKRHGTKAMQMRRAAMSALGSKDPDWLKAAILESFLLGNTGTYGKNIPGYLAMIMQWVQINVPEDYKNMKKNINENI